MLVGVISLHIWIRVEWTVENALCVMSPKIKFIRYFEEPGVHAAGVVHIPRTQKTLKYMHKCSHNNSVMISDIM